jgi:hypothetical protein
MCCCCRKGGRQRPCVAPLAKPQCARPTSACQAASVSARPPTALVCVHLPCLQEGRRVLLLERDYSQPDRIVGELLQPGGYLVLKKLGLETCTDNIDAVKVGSWGRNAGRCRAQPGRACREEADTMCAWWRTAVAALSSSSNSCRCSSASPLVLASLPGVLNMLPCPRCCAGAWLCHVQGWHLCPGHIPHRRLLR